MIGDAHSFYYGTDYGGTDHVLLGNGDSLPIAHTGLM